MYPQLVVITRLPFTKVQVSDSFIFEVELITVHSLYMRSVDYRPPSGISLGMELIYFSSKNALSTFSPLSRQLFILHAVFLFWPLEVGILKSWIWFEMAFYLLSVPCLIYYFSLSPSHDLHFTCISVKVAFTGYVLYSLCVFLDC